MNPDALSRLIEAADFLSFREIARNFLRLRGYREVRPEDGWNDGGTDLRIYERPGNSTPIAFQVTVEKRWKPKIRKDALKAKEKLGLSHFTFVASRRIANTEWESVREDLWDKDSITISKLDGPTIAATYIDEGEVDFVLSTLGIAVRPSGSQPQHDARKEAAFSYALFGEEPLSFKEKAVAAAITSELYARGAIPDAELIGSASAALALNEDDTTLVQSGIDRLRQTGAIKTESGSTRLAPATEDLLKSNIALLESEENELRKEIEKILKDAGVRLKNGLTDSIIDDIGALLVDAAHVNREQVEHPRTPQTSLLNPIRHRLSHLNTLLDATNAPEGIERDRLLSAMTDAAAASGYGKRLMAGELYLCLSMADPKALLHALGGATKIQVVLDTSVAMPMLCGLLHGHVSGSFSSAAAHAYAGMNATNAESFLPKDYLEEAASHLVKAFTDYYSIAEIDEDLVKSENSYVSHFSALRSENATLSFDDYLRAFGYNDQLRRESFTAARDGLMSSLKRLFSMYGIKSHKADYDQSALKRAEKEIAYALQATRQKREGLLVRHDARTIAHLLHSEADADRAVFLCTWDAVQFEACSRADAHWTIVNPAVMGDIFSLVNSYDGTSAAGTASYVARAITEEDAALGAAVLDTIASLESGKLTDGALLQKALDFKRQYVKSHDAKSNSEHIKKQWAAWKESTGPNQLG